MYTRWCHEFLWVYQTHENQNLPSWRTFCYYVKPRFILFWFINHFPYLFNLLSWEVWEYILDFQYFLDVGQGHLGIRPTILSICLFDHVFYLSLWYFDIARTFLLGFREMRGGILKMLGGILEMLAFLLGLANSFLWLKFFSEFLCLN